MSVTTQDNGKPFPANHYQQLKYEEHYSNSRTVIRQKINCK